MRLLPAGVFPLPPARVEELCAQLLARPPHQLKLYLRNSSSHARIEVVRALVRRTFGLRNRDAQEAFRVGRMAFGLARRLRPPQPLRAFARDTLAEALGNLADLFRGRELYRRADFALAAAEGIAAQGTGDPALRALLLEWQAELRRSQRRFDDAVAALRTARDLLTRLEDWPAVARVQILQGAAQIMAGNACEAMDILRAEYALISAHGGPELAFIAAYHLILAHEAAGRPYQAWLMCLHVAPLCPALGLPNVQLRMTWLKGRLESAVGELSVAHRELSSVRETLLERNLPYDAALAGLDLALVLAKQNKPLALAELAREMHEVFTSKQIPSEAAKALAHFERAAASWQVDVAFMDRLLGELAPIRRSTGR